MSWMHFPPINKKFIYLFHTTYLEENVLGKYSAYVPTVVLLLTSLANVATPAVAAFWMNHSSAASILAPLAVIVAHWLPSPYVAASAK